MDKKEEIKRIFNRYTQSNPIFIKSLDDHDDHKLENSMKESLNRIGDSDEVPKSETPDNEDDGNK